MSDIPKSERSESRLEAQHKAYKIRKMITAELMASFAYSQKKQEKHIKAMTDQKRRGEKSNRAEDQGAGGRLRHLVHQKRARPDPRPGAGHLVTPSRSEYDLANLQGRVRREAPGNGQSPGVLQHAPG